jgi:cell division protein FtsB
MIDEYEKTIKNLKKENEELKENIEKLENLTKTQNH